MSNPSERGDGQRRRNPAGGQSVLSSWHFGSQPELKEHKVNLIAMVNEVGARYSQATSETDSSILIRYFHGYFLKYVSLLTRGIISKDGKKVPADTKRFLSLFRLKASDRSNSMSMGEMQMIADRIPNAFINMDADDVYNELVMLFLELARKFNPEIGGFTGYIGHHFKYALKQRMFQVQRDPLNYIPLYEQEIEDNDIGDSEFEDEITQRVNETRSFFEEEEIVSEHEDGYRDSNPKLLESIGLRTLNYSFVSSPPDHLDVVLSKIQRKILVLHFCEGLSFSQISKQLSLGNASSIKAEYGRAIENLQLLADIEVLEGE
jgi:hypothetical protein